MSLITLSSKGNFSKTLNFLRKSAVINKLLMRRLEKYGQMGVDALSKATPKDTGKTAASWGFKLQSFPDGNVLMQWTNSNNVHGIYIAYLIQMGHGTRNGGYVHGVDYINPAIKPIFDKIEKSIWMEVNSTWERA